MLSTTAEYALRIMVVLASAPGAPMTSERIASSTGVPADYAVKVLQMLAKADLVRAQRGRGGGFRIARDAATTSLLDVVDAIDPIARHAKCGTETDHPGLGALHRNLDEAVHLLQQRLAGTMLATLAEAVTPVGAHPANGAG
ncbi:MAG: RrF2 family transcriptional regulator [Planctomycetota bacterium]|jgi:Rrf2 family protein